MATHSLTSIVGSPRVTTAAQAFAFFAIVTSFLSVSLSFVDFLADGLGIEKNRTGKVILCTLTLGPPFGFALLYPKIFLVALNYSGAFGAVVCLECCWLRFEKGAITLKWQSGRLFLKEKPSELWSSLSR